MDEYVAEVGWQRGQQDFLDNQYSRRHWLRFDSGQEIAASSSPHVVPVPLSDPNALDPEEAFIASLSSCHMLWFLSIAAKRRFLVDTYHDRVSGQMGKNEAGKLYIAKVILRPEVSFSGERLPTREQIEQMHQQAHEECFIASSVKSEVLCEPRRDAVASGDARQLSPWCTGQDHGATRSGTTAGQLYALSASARTAAAAKMTTHRLPRSRCSLLWN
jgi:organic hydroperoxide reductase OsmC/OhrA